MQTEAKVQPLSKFGDEEDYDLIGYMALRAEDPVGAELAWQEFYRRHFPYLFGVVGRGYLKVLDEMCLEELSTEAIIRGFESAHTFNPHPAANPSRQTAHVRAWLGEIATNLLNSELLKYKGLQIIYPDTPDEDGQNGWEPIEHEASIKNDNEWVSRDSLSALRKSWVQEAFNNLDDREQHILRVTLEYERPDRVHQKLPDAISNWLKDVHNTTSENIRQIRKRAKLKIEKHVKAMSDKYCEENQGKG